jgi:serine/threonine-protein phosphatase 4 regulatory subunit 2
MVTLFYSEELVSSLEAFSSQQEKLVTPELLKIVDNISKTGVVCFPWSTLKPLLGYLLSQSLKGYVAKISDINTVKSEDEENDVDKRSLRFLYALDSFDEAPFTVQRLCELILSPEKVYSTYFKYISALEKMVNISSTLPTLTPHQIQTVNLTGIINPQPEDEGNNNNNNNNNEEYPTSMNLDFNGLQSVFPQLSSGSYAHAIETRATYNEINDKNNGKNNDTDSNANVNNESLTNNDEKSPTPMDM